MKTFAAALLLGATLAVKLEAGPATDALATAGGDAPDLMQDSELAELTSDNWDGSGSASDFDSSSGSDSDDSSDDAEEHGSSSGPDGGRKNPYRYSWRHTWDWHDYEENR